MYSLLINISDFLQDIEKDLNCEAQLVDIGDRDFLKLSNLNMNKFTKYIKQNGDIYIGLSDMREYIQEQTGIKISDRYDIIETNLTGVNDEYLVYYL